MGSATSTAAPRVNTFPNFCLIDVPNQLLRLAANQMSMGWNLAARRAPPPPTLHHPVSPPPWLPPARGLFSMQPIPNRLLVWRRANEIPSAASPYRLTHYVTAIDSR